MQKQCWYADVKMNQGRKITIKYNELLRAALRADDTKSSAAGLVAPTAMASKPKDRTLSLIKLCLLYKQLNHLLTSA